jgi:hypothetical protein
MEVLTAYVRQHAPWRPEGAQQVGEEAAVEKKSEEDSSGESETPEAPAPAADIQAILTVIRRRTRTLGHGEPERLGLGETNLSRAVLDGANLSGADLVGANFSEAVLRGANLSGADLSGAVGKDMVRRREHPAPSRPRASRALGPQASRASEREDRRTERGGLRALMNFAEFVFHALG